MTEARLRVALVAAVAGGIIGSLARAALTAGTEVGDGFPTMVFAINVVGSALLAGLPALAVVRRRPWLGVFLGTGVLGGFTTMSAASAETVVLIDNDQVTTAVAYAGGTLLVAVAAVALVTRLTATRSAA